MRLLDYIRTNNKKLGKGLLPRKLLALCVLLLLPFANTLSAVHFDLYGTIGTGGSFTESTLITIDQTTGALKETIGPVGYLVNGLAFDPTTGNLYASTANNDPNFRGLISIDTLTGIGTPIGSGWGLPLGDAIVCITCNAAGQLYGWIEPSPSSQDDLVIIDKTAGTFSQFPNAGLSTWTLGLDFDSSGTLWLFNGTQSMYTINLTTGAPTLMGTFTPQFVHHGKFNPDTWNFWGIDESYGDNPRNIAIIDVPGGAQLGSLPTVDDLHTLAFVVKELSSSEIKGRQRHDQFLTETEYYNVIEWAHMTDNDVVATYLYRNGQLIAKLPASATSYVDHNQKRKKAVEYSVQAIFSNGFRSNPTSVIIK